MENFPDEINNEYSNNNINNNNIKNEEANNNINENKSQNIYENNKKIEDNNLNINKEKKKIKKKEKVDKAEVIKEVKKYLNYNNKDTEYTDIIKNTPNALFDTLKESTIMKWEVKLFNNFSYTKTTTDEDILGIEKDTKFQLVIKNDAVRTRVRESIIIDNFKETLENMITY